MSLDWLTTSSYERTGKLITDINTVSVHVKLMLAGREDSSRADRVRDAKEHLRRFLKDLSPVVNALRRDSSTTVLGSDPRLEELARTLATAVQGTDRPGIPALADVAETVDLLDSTSRKDQRLLVGQLRALRTLLEQYAHHDVLAVLGEPWR